MPKAFSKAEEQLTSLVEAFRTGDVEEAVGKTLLVPEDGDVRPIDSWSLSNRAMCYVAGTEDARGFRQWKEVDRYVKKGARAIRILVPKISKVEEKVERVVGGEVVTETEEVEKVVGFYAAPVFRLEDTEGEPLPEYDYSPPELPPLYGVAEEMGLDVSYDASRTGKRYGSFRPGRREIALFTHNHQTFWHEMAHAAHAEVTGGLEPGQHPEQEAVAELSAAVLARMYGAPNDGYSHDYLERYAGDHEARDAYGLCLSVLSDVEKVLEYLLD